MKDEKNNVLFESLLAIASGLALGAYSSGLFVIFVFLIFFEYCVFVFDTLGANKNDGLDRVLIAVVYLFGWTMSRFLFIRETGLEPLAENIELFYNTFPN